MIDAVNWFIDEGHYQFFTADSIDNQSWSNGWAHPADRARRHEDYDRYITRNWCRSIRQPGGEDATLLTTGVSMGGYHSANFFFRHPDIFDSSGQPERAVSVEHVHRRLYGRECLLQFTAALPV
jgi:esterase/lipase superfamily enzyme